MSSSRNCQSTTLAVGWTEKEGEGEKDAAGERDRHFCHINPHSFRVESTIGNSSQSELVSSKNRLKLPCCKVIPNSLIPRSNVTVWKELRGIRP